MQNGHMKRQVGPSESKLDIYDYWTGHSWAGWAFLLLMLMQDSKNWDLMEAPTELTTMQWPMGVTRQEELEEGQVLGQM